MADTEVAPQVKYFPHSSSSVGPESDFEFNFVLRTMQEWVSMQSLEVSTLFFCKQGVSWFYTHQTNSESSESIFFQVLFCVCFREDNLNIIPGCCCRNCVRGL